MRDNADHQHGTHDHAFGVGAAHEAGHGAEPLAPDSSSSGLHEGISEHLGVSEPHAGAVGAGHVLPGHPGADHHLPHDTFDDHSHLGDGGGGHFGLGIDHDHADHADGLSGLHDSIHEGGLGFHGDEHHGLGDALHVGHDHPDAHDHGHGLGELFHH
jgi:hypothetical protein